MNPKTKQAKQNSTENYLPYKVLSFTDSDSAFQELLTSWRQHPLRFAFCKECSSWANIHGWIQDATFLGKAGSVAQYLVGAKLQLRFPDLLIPNDRYSSADQQTGRYGDFQVEDTAFHVTVSPMPAVYAKCLRNIEAGCRVYLLVPDDVLMGARQNARSVAADKIAVESLESFIANNIEELAQFSKDRLISGFKRLLEKYNERVNAIEMDKSLLIEIPPSIS